eukprot:TRINITY_DN1412_c0_g1_i1.p1 TRINITY_DN1412_c0_g1~~TRINITY_DN1412_c0_g1_i1.p1  ORF type:complete len:354 (+),score=91.32 TRINITY_DN1412_c0_g1_i1:252-1313(+)
MHLPSPPPQLPVHSDSVRPYTTMSIKQEQDGAVEVVKVDALVVLKMIKHCRENLPDLVTGQLLGLDVDRSLEVTNCFPFPSSADGEDGDEAGTQYQIEMMRCLREVNVDSNTVGWYTSSYMSSHLNKSVLEAQYNFQSTFPRSVMLVYDPLRTSQGSLALTALRLSDKFFALYKRGEFTKDSVTELNLSFADIYQQIPVEVSNSGVFKAMLLELGDNAAFQPTFESLDMATNSFLENNLETLNLCISDLQQEQGKQQMWQRNANKVLAQQQAFLQRRKAENAQRKAMGQDLLPETAADLEHENPALFKLPSEPSRLEALLITNQINNHCEEILKFGGQSLSKLFVSKSLISGK